MGRGGFALGCSRSVTFKGERMELGDLAGPQKPTAANLERTLESKLPRQNVNIIRLDETYAVRIAKIHGRFPWHSHPYGDEGWMVWEGRMTINTEVGDVELEKGDFTVIPKGMKHSPIGT